MVENKDEKRFKGKRIDLEHSLNLKEKIYIGNNIRPNRNNRRDYQKKFCFANLKAAFDKLIRNKIWKWMRKKQVKEEIIERLQEIYEETAVKMVVNEEVLD